jgi:L-fucono-1,5-lactonase
MGLALRSGSLASSPLPVIDSHIHFLDPRLPEGITWRTQDMPVYRPVLPPEYRNLAKRHNVTGVMVIEASSRMETNDWLLDLAGKESLIVGYVRRLTPGTPEFGKLLEEYQKNPLFQGIRIYFGMLGHALSQPQFLADLKRMADRGLAINVAGGPPQLPVALGNLARITDKIPNLRFVIDHLPMPTPESAADRSLLKSAFREISQRPTVYAKASEVIRRVGEWAPVELNHWRSALDEIWEVFGADRLIYGSNWPASAPVARYEQVFSVVHEYFSGKGADVAEKYFRKNSQAAYRWKSRDASQPGAKA